jgi:CHAT domain-containing protein
MPIKLNTSDWTRQRAGTTRGLAAVMPGLPREFVRDDASTEEVVVAPQPTVRGAAAVPSALDVTVDLAPNEAAVLALRHPSGALTFHAARQETRRTRGGATEARFIVPVRSVDTSGDTSANRGLASKLFKVVIVKIADSIGDRAAGLVLPKLVRLFETTVWKQKQLTEGWLRVTQESLASGRLDRANPSSEERSLLFIHGTFSNAAAAFRSLAHSTFFDDVAPLYGDRIFAFDHFSLSRTPEENVRMLLEDLPSKNFHFDVITHSRGGLVLRNLVERSAAFGDLASRFSLGRAVLVAAPNEGTPLATPSRWEDTVGWVANLLELFPENPFTTGAEFVANGLVWIARHASGGLPGIHSMDGDGPLIRELQSPPGPPADRYSVLAANYSPGGNVLRRLLDVGIDQFFNTANDLVVPSEGGWRVDPSGGTFIPGSRIGCFGPGGNIARDEVTHVNFFAQPETVSFLVAALGDQPQKLTPLDPAQRLPDRRLIRAGAPGLSAPAVAAGTQPPAAKRARFHGRETRAAVAAETALRLTVVNGDLTFEDRPLLLGHYRSTRLSGTEAVIDPLLGGAMSDSLDLGVYPVEPGSHRIFPNRARVPVGRFWQTPRPQAVIVAGLGQEGKLQAAQIVHTVRQAVIAWAERVSEDEPRVRELTLATTLLASGGTGITPGQAAQLIAQGVHEANELIQRSREGRPAGQQSRPGLPNVRELRFIELYLSRATEAWEALKMLAHSAQERYIVGEPIIEAAGALRRPLVSGYRGADYDFITAETGQDVNGNTFISYALDTKRARTEIRAQAAQARLLRDLVATASSDLNTERQIGRTLFNLLIPIELESFLASSGETQIEVDSGTAGIPWELLDDSTSSAAQRLPWAIRAKLLRKFRTETFRTHVNDADTEASVLVIGEPQCPAGYPPLPGALDEARQVFGLLTSPTGLDAKNVHKLFADDESQTGPDARQVVDTLFERSWRIVHIAGHGEPVSAKGDRGGVVLSNDTFLGASEIKAMRVVPELVFVNCCHLAAGSRRSMLRDPQRGVYDRAAFASSVAQALIEVGVRCVVAAGWAVDDTAASAFATTFYEALLRGQRFIEAVGEARRKAFEFDGNTWAAYQCYGDADWTFLRHSSSSRTSRSAPEDEFDGVASVNALKLALDTLVVQSTFQGYPPADQRERVRRLQDRWAAMRWDASSDVAERFARACAAANDLPGAIRWYETAIESAGGEISFRVLEQVSNLRIRHSVESAQTARTEQERLNVADGKGRVQRPDAGRREAARQRADANKRLRAASKLARDTITEEMRRLAQLADFQQTAERENMRGSAMKRLAMLETADGRAAAARRAIEAMRKHYQRGLDIAREQNSDNLFYPAVNVIAAELALRGGTVRWTSLSALFEEARRNVAAKNKSNPDFWSLIAEPELRLYEALVRGKLSKAEAGSIMRAFVDVFHRSQAGSELKSIADTMHFVVDRYVSIKGAKSTANVKTLLANLDKQIENRMHATTAAS